jgi:hypothetical protein
VGRLHIILIGLMLVPALSSMHSAFNGTWRTDPEKPRAEDTTFKIRGDTLTTLDSRTIEESDLNGGTVVQIRRWSPGPDGNSMQARFDDTHGHIQERKLGR